MLDHVLKRLECRHGEYNADVQTGDRTLDKEDDDDDDERDDESSLNEKTLIGDEDDVEAWSSLHLFIIFI